MICVSVHFRMGTLLEFCRYTPDPVYCCAPKPLPVRYAIPPGMRGTFEVGDDETLARFGVGNVYWTAWLQVPFWLTVALPGYVPYGTVISICPDAQLTTGTLLELAKST